MDPNMLTDGEFSQTFGLTRKAVGKLENFLKVFKGLENSVTVQVHGGAYYTFQTKEILLVYLRTLVISDWLKVAGEFGRPIDAISGGAIFMSDHINATAKEYLNGGEQRWWDSAVATRNSEVINLRFDVPLSNVCLIIDSIIKTPKLVAAFCPQGLFIFVSNISTNPVSVMSLADRYNIYDTVGQLTQFEDFSGVAYGDTSFRNEGPVVTPLHPCSTPASRIWNRKMQPVQISTELAFEEVYSLFPTIRGNPLLEVFLSVPATLVAKNLFNSFFLANINACASEGNYISAYFATQPPSIEEYFGVAENSLD